MTLGEEKAVPGGIYNPERDATPQYRATVRSWIDASQEVFVVMRYLRGGGAKDYALIKNEAEFEHLLELLPEGTDTIVFRKSQLPCRGLVTDQFIEDAKQTILDGAEYLFIRMDPETPGDPRLCGEMGGSHRELEDDLTEERGKRVALGNCPPFVGDDNEDMISASIGGIDGPR